MRRSVIALAALIAGCAAPKPPPAAVDVPVESWEQVAVGEINARIDRGAGDARQSSPLSIALGFLGGDAGARSLTIDQRTNRAEAADTTVIVIVRDGLPDDSVRGDWHRIVLRRLDDRTWRVHEARRAFRCWRGHHTESYGSEWCP